MKNETRFKLLALDMDGTTLNSSHSLSLNTINAINSFAEKGVKVVFATGRMPSAVAEHLTHIKSDGLVVTHNGALVKNILTNEVLVKKTVDAKVTKTVIDYARKFKLTLHINLEDSTLIEKDSDKSDLYADELRIDLKKVTNFDEINELPISLLLISQKELLENFLELYKKSDGLNFDYVLMPWNEDDWMLQLLPPNTSKGNAVIELANRLNIDPSKEVISFGDSYNDFELIKGTFFGVAMDNACKELKIIADYVTKSNDNDGVAFVLEQLMINEARFVSSLK
ncbi:Cof-type HAD-IIB family hydrolase [Enterococcus quebecensis]|uniref:HAD family hydrolase n=1 Tax=Enterococcus quebecensis TaxID=903983 RepID=A0A1E5GTE3_9ENTE|nr:Cof-type HAD-IIB family hydrolase [Enterococcus quebecensis]OEG15958.1 hypothetical protein BCR23_07360 [Enterococcus quebecensis]OJG74930.1 cof-like hydrolase [Enterococcus quebecensis]